jgi:aspartate kinase
MQNSAMSFSVCIEDTFNRFEVLANSLQDEFYIKYNKQVNLLTIRHINEEEWNNIFRHYRVLLSQKTGKTAQFVVE